MARRLDKERVIKMRLEESLSYSQIKKITGISKGTLSDWLAPYPLSKERILELQANSEQRIESYRNTMRLKKEARLAEVYKKVAIDIGFLNKRERFIAGLFLYWGEGGKTCYLSFANTDPCMIKFFISWLRDFGIKDEDLKIRLDLYKDMDLQKEALFWENVTNLAHQNFKIVLKKTSLAGLTYKNGFGHGTCRIVVYKKKPFDFLIQSLKFIKKDY